MIMNGSEKQNAWAEKILAEWAAEIDREVSALEQHAYAETIKDAIDSMKAARARFNAGNEKITARQVIDLHTAGGNVARKLIKDVKSKF